MTAIRKMFEKCHRPRFRNCKFWIICVGEQFTGSPGRYVSLKETIRGFKEILAGQHDDMPEGAFYMVGTIDEAIEKAEKMKKGE